MDPNAEQPVQIQGPRSSFSCDRHPTEQFNGFCPSCLCERLATLEPPLEPAASSSRRPSNAAASALKSIFQRPSEAKTKPKQAPQQPEMLRRTQSFSASKNEVFSGVLEPQRHSCDVRGRSTLWSLIFLDSVDSNNNRKSSASVLDQDQIQEESESSDNDDEIRVCEEVPVILPGFTQEEEPEREEEKEEVKTIKDHIILESQPKKPSAMDLKEIAGNFWSAASVFSKKWQKWRQNHKLKKNLSRRGGPTLPVEKPISRQFRETQSEIADYGFGRRSCDIDPARFSLDVPRMSFDDVRPSFDQPRASWDGHLMGGSRSFARLPPILSVVEDSPARGTSTMGNQFLVPPLSPVVHVARSDMQIPVEEDEKVPGGTVQTREYYSGRRKSLDRSNSIRKMAATVVAEMDEMKVAPVPVPAPAVVEHRMSVDSNKSLRDDCSETFELGFRDNGTVVGERKGIKKSRKWKNIWGLIIRRSAGAKYEDEEERYSKGSGVDRSLSSSWQELRRERNGETRGGMNRSVLRSNSSASWRNSSTNGGSFGSGRNTTGFETNGRSFERNRSARYSPNHIDNGLLRFYLAPLKGSCRRGGGGGGLGKSRSNNSHSIARSVLRLY